jgi:hypothetical protein
MLTTRRQFMRASATAAAPVSVLGTTAFAQTAPAAVETPTFRDLFNGRDLTGWVPPEGGEKTWSVRDGVLVCSGRPNGVMRTDRAYENFVLQVDWMHMEPGGNSGLYVWCSAPPRPSGIEIQILDLEWMNLQTADAVRIRESTPPPAIAFVHGELIGVGGVKFVPDNPRGARSMSIENRARGRGQWNTYTVVAIDGVLKLAVNGTFVNGASRTTQKKGYVGLQSEGAPRPGPPLQDRPD